MSASSCVVAATIGVSSLWLAGLVAGRDYLLNIATWWVGDTIGTIIFGSLVLIWTLKGQVWRRRLLVTLPMGFTFAVAVLLFVHARRWEQERIRSDFEHRTESLAYRIGRDFDSYINRLHSIESFFASSQAVSREEFHTFVERDLARHRAIHALAWDPVVQESERQEFEKEARRAGLTNFQITERDRTSRLVRVSGSKSRTSRGKPDARTCGPSSRAIGQGNRGNQGSSGRCLPP